MYICPSKEYNNYYSNKFILLKPLNLTMKIKYLNGVYSKLNKTNLVAIIVVNVFMMIIISHKFYYSYSISFGSYLDNLFKKNNIDIFSLFWIAALILLVLFITYYLMWLFESRRNINKVIKANKGSGISLKDYKTEPYKYIIFFFFPYWIMSTLFEKANDLIDLGIVKSKNSLNDILVDISWFIYFIYIGLYTYFIIHVIKTSGEFTIHILANSIYYIIFITFSSTLLSIVNLILIHHYSKFEKKMLKINDE